MIFFKNVKEYLRIGNADRPVSAADLKAEKVWQASWWKYWSHLDGIADRLGPNAYKFFRFGANETGLHDGYLLSFTFGDSIDSSESSYPKLRFGKGPTTVAITVLNYEKSKLHQFIFKGPRRVLVDTPSADPLYFGEGKTLGHINHYEVAAISPKYLSVEWLLDSGGTILIECEKLMYSSKRVKIADTKKRRTT